MNINKVLATSSLSLIALLTMGTANANDSAIPYPNAGTISTTTSDFTATSTGVVTAYFAGSTAGYEEELGLLSGGALLTDTAGNLYGLDNKSTIIGDSVSWNVTAGQKLTFVDNILSANYSLYSNPALNPDGVQHIYATSFTGGAASNNISNYQEINGQWVSLGQTGANLPSGTFVAFEDLLIPGADLNYNDMTFVFTNVSAPGVTTNVPEPASIALLSAGLLGLGLSRRKDRR